MRRRGVDNRFFLLDEHGHVSIAFYAAEGVDGGSKSGGFCTWCFNRLLCGGGGRLKKLVDRVDPSVFQSPSMRRRGSRPRRRPRLTTDRGCFNRLLCGERGSTVNTHSESSTREVFQSPSMRRRVDHGGGDKQSLLPRCFNRLLCGGGSTVSGACREWTLWVSIAFYAAEGSTWGNVTGLWQISRFQSPSMRRRGVDVQTAGKQIHTLRFNRLLCGGGRRGRTIIDLGSKGFQSPSMRRRVDTVARP